eukprot:gene31320-53609_t
MWHRQPWLIDHGAALTFHHAWNGVVAQPAKPFAPIADHVLLARATALAQVDAELAARLTPEVVAHILGDVPDEFLALAGAEHAEGPLAAPASHRQAYVDYFCARLAGRATLSMHAPEVYDYAIVRVVPRVEREEFINAGVILSCQRSGFLQAAIALDEARLLAMDPHADIDTVRRHLAAIVAICAGDEACGPIARLPYRQ